MIPFLVLIFSFGVPQGVLTALLIFMGVVFLVINGGIGLSLAFKKGTVGANQYGPDPLGTPETEEPVQPMRYPHNTAWTPEQIDHLYNEAAGQMRKSDIP
jgi:hypothetical protein